MATNQSQQTSIKIPGYDLKEKIYSGLRTLVYRGFSQEEQKPVVIKLLRKEYPNFNELVQFRNQYTITKNLDGVGIAKTEALVTYGNGLALVMEDDGSISLSQEIQQREVNNLSLEEFFPLAIQLAQILEELYQNRVIHKDIKPANILINQETNQVRLIDFSIASLLQKEQKEIQNPNILEGTLAYISPEQTGRMNRGIDYRSDFYSLGVTFYELLTGKLPFASDDAMELVHCHLAKMPMSVTSYQLPVIKKKIPQMVGEIVMKLMAKNAEERYQSALGLRYDLEKCWQQWQETGEIATFALGERDICDHLLIPEKLYGRKTEVTQLLDAFERVSAGNTEMMLVAGFSGIGKTAVIKEVHKPIVQQRGYFIKGKFDQFNRNIPLSAFVQAFRNLMEQLLSESDTQLQQWKSEILSALGENGQVIIKVIPELAEIIGKQPPIPDLSGTSEQNRFNLFFSKFIQVFTTKEHPLVLFLDDLQWADSASLSLMKLLMAKTKTGYLLILGAYRDNEVDPTHPLILTLDEVARNEAIVNTLNLSPLTQNGLNHLIADTLSCTLELAVPLTELVYQKTQGNPFFATQFLKSLYEEGWISFDRELGYWQCDLVSVRQLALTENVIGFMAAQLQRLPLDTQKVLKLAACIGNQFDLTTLAIVSELSEEETAVALWQALQGSFLQPTNEVYKFYQSGDRLINLPDIEKQSPSYKFAHDRIQQAAYSLIPEKQKQVTHYHIGQLLWQKIPPETREERIFELVSQLNYGIDLIREQKEREELAELNLMACRKARATSAYQTGLEYASTGLLLLGESPWQQQYEMSLAFHNLSAELAWLCGSFAEMEKFIQVVINQAHSLLEQIDVYLIRIQAHASQNKLTEAVAIAQQLLEKLGVDFPDSPTPENIQQEFAEIKKLMGEREIEDLVSLPLIENKEKLAIVQIAINIMPAAYMSGSPLYPLIVALSVKLSIQYGNAPESAIGYVTYGLLACNMQQDINTGFKFGQLALQLVEQLDAKTVKPDVLNVMGLFILLRKSHLQETLPLLQRGYIAALEVGTLQYVGYNASTLCFNSFWCSQSLVTFHQKSLAYTDTLMQLNQLTAANWCQIYSQSTLNLLEAKQKPTILSGENLQEAELLGQLLNSHDLFGLYFFYLYKLMLCYLFEEIESAQDYAVEIRKYLRAGSGNVGEPTFYFYDSLIALANLTSQSEAASKIFQQVEQNQTQLQQQWANYAPMNYQHKVDLVAAEKCRVLGQNLEAIELYEKAIAGSKENNYVQEEAIANELAAKFYLHWGKEKIAQTYMVEAYYSYARWGAKAKVKHLQKAYPQLLNPIFQQPRSPQAYDITTNSSSNQTICSTTSSSLLDVSAAVKASQVLSGEIELEALLAKLMQIVLENAGADYSALVLSNVGTWEVVVQCREKNCQLSSTPLDEAKTLPVNIIRAVQRSQETIIINQVKNDTRFARDNYLLQQQPKSIFCTPIVNGGKLIGILYLENNLCVDTFTTERVEVLNLLCSQAAISLENARLYQQLEAYSQTLEEKVKQRTSQLKTAQQQIISQEKLASLGALTAGVAHELRNPLNFVNNYAEGSVELGVELIEALETPEALTPDNVDILKEIAEDLKDNAAAIQKHGQRAESIIYNMMQHSRSEDSSRQITDINKLLEEAKQLSYHSRRSRDNSFNITFTTEYDDSVGELEVFSASLSRAFINLIDNGCYAAWKKYVANEQKVSPQLWITTKNLGKEIEIRIRDNGKGIPDQVREKIFEPFFTTKPTGEGTGLGLSLTHEIIVGQHGGTLRVDTEPGNFTEFILALPKK